MNREIMKKTRGETVRKLKSEQLQPRYMVGNSKEKHNIMRLKNMEEEFSDSLGGGVFPNPVTPI